MKKIVLSLILASSGMAITMSFNKADCLKEYWGTKKLYQPTDTSATPPPAGYEAAFINYAGRHGARHLTSLDELLSIQQVLKNAADEKMLTVEGIRLQDITDTLLLVEKKEDCGLLTISGKEEQMGIGRRMRANYPTLFNDPDTYIKIVTTKEKRTKQSAASFMQGMSRGMQPGTFTQIADNDSVQLRFFEVSPGYKNFKKKGNWIADMDKLENDKYTQQENEKIIHTFFKNDYAVHMFQTADHKAQSMAANFLDALFNITTLSNTMKAEITAAGYEPARLDVRTLFTCDELERLEFINSAKDFLIKGPGTNVDGIQVRNAAPLLVDFIKTTDSMLLYNKGAFIGRFAHAETICPFAALLGIKGASTPVSNINTYNKVWDVSEVMGFSANVQWVVYKSKIPGKDVLVKILYNEKPAEIPVATDQYPYYKWQDVKQFYINKLHRIDVDLNTDMLAYLQHLK